MRRVAVVIAVLLLAGSAACAGPDIVRETQEARPGDLMGFEIGLVDPFGDGAASYGALMLPIKVLPIEPPDNITPENWYRTVPQYLLASAALEIIAPFTMDGVDLGLSIHALSIRQSLPVRLGINHTDAGWGWHVTGAVWSF